MDAGTLEQGCIAELTDDEAGCLAERLHQVDCRHLAEVTHHGSDRHALQQCIPNRDLVQPLGRDGLARQVEVVDQANDLGLARSLLGLLEGCNDLRQLARWGISCHTVFAVNLALNGALAQTFRAPERIQRKTASCSAEGAFG